MPTRSSVASSDIWPALRETFSETRRFGAHYLRRYGLSMSQAMAMHKIRDAGGLRLSVLAASLGISRPATSSLVDSLESGGWAHRERSATDRRGVLVRLTPRAAALLRGFDRAFERAVRTATGDLPASRRAATVAALGALCAGLRAQRSDAPRGPAGRADR